MHDFLTLKTKTQFGIKIKRCLSVCAMWLLACCTSLHAQDYRVKPGSFSLATTTLHRNHNVESSLEVENIGTTVLPTGLEIAYQLVASNGTVLPLPWRLNETSAIQNGGIRQFYGPGSSEASVAVDTNFIATNAIAPGNYTLRVVIDPDQLRTDTNRANNTSVLGPVTVAPVPAVRLIGGLDKIEAGGAGQPLSAGQQFTITARYENGGDLADIPAFDIDFFLVPPDGNGLWGTSFTRGNAVFLGRRSTSVPWPAGQQIQNPVRGLTATFALPSGLEHAVYRLGVIVDSTQALEEQITGQPQPERTFGSVSASSETVSVRYVLERPDYTATNILGPDVSTIPAGELVTFRGSMRNNTAFGSGDVCVIRHYLTRYPSGTPVSLGITLFAGLAGNQTRAYEASLRVPGNLIAGEYYYTCRIDETDVIPESNDLNNLGINTQNRLNVTAAQKPDLVPVEPASFTPSPRLPGQSLTVEATVKNQSSFPSSASFRVAFALSADSVAGNGDDIPIGSVIQSQSIAANSTRVVSATLTLPNAATPPPGYYRFVWHVDSDGQVDELVETNNRKVLNSPRLNITTPLPDPSDLLPAGIDRIPQQGIFGETIPFTVTFGNKGKGPAAASSFRIWLSPDDIPGNADDVLIHTDALVAIGPGDEKEITFSAKLPGDRNPPGLYHIVVKADSSSVINESDETNNLALFPQARIWVLPEQERDYPSLFFTACAASPTTLLPGQEFNAFASLANKGAADAVGLHLRVVLSPDAIIGNANDIPLHDFPYFALAGGSSIELEETLTLTPDALPGSYLGWIMNPGAAIPAGVMSKPIVTQTITVREPRLAIRYVERQATADVIALEDTQTGISYSVRYSGNMTTGGWVATPPQEGRSGAEIHFTIPRLPSVKTRYFRGVAE